MFAAVLVALVFHRAVQHCYWQLLVLLLVGPQTVQHCYWELLNPAAAVPWRWAKGLQAEAAEAPPTEAKAAKEAEAAEAPRTEAPRTEASAAPTCFLSWSYYKRTPCTTCLTNMPSNPLEESHSAERAHHGCSNMAIHA